MTLKYSMDEANNVAKKASSEIEAYLQTLSNTVDVINVENDEAYRRKDIDLLWVHKENDSKRITSIEIKGDRWYKTGNYFLETISNKSKGTPGCFMYTEADFIYYYFVTERELHILPMPETKNWFIKNINRFVQKETSTPVNGQYYITVGRLVPRRMLQNEVSGAKIVNILL